MIALQFRGPAVFYSRTSEALFLFIRLLIAGSLTFGTYPSITAIAGIIKRYCAEKRRRVLSPHFSMLSSVKQSFHAVSRKSFSRS